MTPEEASRKEKEDRVYLNLYGQEISQIAKPKFKVGDKVRISKYKRKFFHKECTPNWTEEIFVVGKIQHTNPITYKTRGCLNSLTRPFSFLLLVFVVVSY